MPYSISSQLNRVGLVLLVPLQLSNLTEYFLSKQFFALICYTFYSSDYSYNTYFICFISSSKKKKIASFRFSAFLFYFFIIIIIWFSTSLPSFLPSSSLSYIFIPIINSLIYSRMYLFIYLLVSGVISLRCRSLGSPFCHLVCSSGSRVPVRFGNVLERSLVSQTFQDGGSRGVCRNHFRCQNLKLWV